MRSLGIKAGGVGPDGLPLPPPKLLFRVTGTTEAIWFVEGGRLTEESIRAALARAGAPLESLEAISVLTHLPVKTQLAWRDELGRVLRPGGHLLLTVHGEAYFEQLTNEERLIYAEGDHQNRR